MQYVALLVFFIIAGTFGLGLANFELRKPNNRYNMTKEDAKWTDWLSIFMLSGFYGLVLPIAVKHFMFDGKLNHELFGMFALLGALIKEGVFPMAFHAMGKVANGLSKYYNESINEEINSNTTDTNHIPPQGPEDDGS